jgi:hypothetical protein
MDNLHARATAITRAIIQRQDARVSSQGVVQGTSAGDATRTDAPTDD